MVKILNLRLCEIYIKMRNIDVSFWKSGRGEKKEGGDCLLEKEAMSCDCEAVFFIFYFYFHVGSGARPLRMGTRHRALSVLGSVEELSFSRPHSWAQTLWTIPPQKTIITIYIYILSIF